MFKIRLEHIGQTVALHATKWVDLYLAVQVLLKDFPMMEVEQ